MKTGHYNFLGRGCPPPSHYHCPSSPASGPSAEPEKKDRHLLHYSDGGHHHRHHHHHSLPGRSRSFPLRPPPPVVKEEKKEEK